MFIFQIWKPTWFWMKNWGICPVAAVFACWNIANCWICCWIDCCCCCKEDASAWISWGLRLLSGLCMSNCWPTIWASAAWLLELLTWHPVNWLLTPELGEEALPLVPLLLFLWDTSVTWNTDQDMSFKLHHRSKRYEIFDLRSQKLKISYQFSFSFTQKFCLCCF